MAAKAKPHYIWKTMSIRCLRAPEVQELFNTVHSAANDCYVGGLWTVSEILQLCLGTGDFKTRIRMVYYNCLNDIIYCVFA